MIKETDTIYPAYPKIPKGYEILGGGSKIKNGDWSLHTWDDGTRAAMQWEKLTDLKPSEIWFVKKGQIYIRKKGTTFYRGDQG